MKQTKRCSPLSKRSIQRGDNWTRYHSPQPQAIDQRAEAVVFSWFSGEYQSQLCTFHPTFFVLTEGAGPMDEGQRACLARLDGGRVGDCFW